MHSTISRRARQGTAIGMVLDAVTLFSGCATLEPVVLPEIDSDDNSSSSNDQVDELTEEYNPILADYQNAFVNLQALTQQYSDPCISAVQAAFEPHYNDLLSLASGPLKTIQGQASSGQDIDQALAKEVSTGLDAAKQYNATINPSLVACGVQ